MEITLPGSGNIYAGNCRCRLERMFKHSVAHNKTAFKECDESSPTRSNPNLESMQHEKETGRQELDAEQTLYQNRTETPTG